MNLRLSPQWTGSEVSLRASQQEAEWRVSSGNHGNAHPSPSVVSSAVFRRSSGREATITEEAEPLDIWAAITPGYVREKIAIFGSDGRAPSPGVARDKDRGVSGLCRVRKSKGRWEEKGGAKRQRQLANEQDAPSPDRRRGAWSPGSGVLAEGEEPRPSVVAMVACLEQRFLQQRRGPKAPHKPAPLTLTEAPPTQPDSVRVSAMVTRLEPDCPRAQTRTAGRVLLATPHIGSSPCRPSATPAPLAPPRVSREPITSCSTATPPSGGSGELAARQQAPDPPSQSVEAEPLPGLLFGTLAPPQTFTTPALGPSPPPGGGASGQVSGARTCAFLEARRRLQRLLEPPPPLALLPHHLLVRIFGLLPTRSLAALKCSCRCFRLLITTYDVRPADALWVSDPAYRHDPCKQCKKRRGRGDASLCRWHHKPFCQALPFGPGYWMCCRGARRDAPGCNVGLHDNRWVPAFHSRSLRGGVPARTLTQDAPPPGLVAAALS